MMISLSKEQRQKADRVPGLELILPWPKQLPAPRDLPLNEERDATAAEWAAARAIVGIPQEGGRTPYIVRGVKAAMLRRPADMAEDPGIIAPHLCVEIVAPRWYHATRRPPPYESWVGPRAQRRRPEDLDFDGMDFAALCRALRERWGVDLAGQEAITRIPAKTWAQWERDPGKASARRPANEAAMRNYFRLLDREHHRAT